MGHRQLPQHRRPGTHLGHLRRLRTAGCHRRNSQREGARPPWRPRQGRLPGPNGPGTGCLVLLFPRFLTFHGCGRRRAPLARKMRSLVETRHRPLRASHEQGTRQRDTPPAPNQLADSQKVRQSASLAAGGFRVRAGLSRVGRRGWGVLGHLGALDKDGFQDLVDRARVAQFSFFPVS